MRKQRDRLFDLGMTASISEIEFKRQMNRLDAEIASKRSRLAEATSALTNDAGAARTMDKARGLIADFSVLYQHASYERKRELVAAIAEALGGLSVSREGLSWDREGGKARQS